MHKVSKMNQSQKSKTPNLDLIFMCADYERNMSQRDHAVPKMREIRFDPEFWPRMHTVMNTPPSIGRYTNWENKTLFLKSLSKTLTELAIEDEFKLKYDFDRFPIESVYEKDNLGGEWRRANVPVDDIGLSISFRWKFMNERKAIYVKSMLEAERMNVNGNE